MEYTNMFQPLLLIFVSCGIGMILGSCHMFLIMYHENKRLKKELDTKSNILNSYIFIYGGTGISDFKNRV